MMEKTNIEDVILAIVCENCPDFDKCTQDPDKCPTLKLVRSDKRLQKIIINIFSLPYGTNTKEVIRDEEE
ncbi:MAG: hypothetical protein Q6351_004815 [Candidatus Njordarchaeum guaymaensis]